ncbi:uncharacterized protein EAF01_005017 [Botrytis porri]|uniref:Aflatoxin regulatory protein domain-containing protein n=1 Tax=Botrytis porri TaxID=87229 RepID=A0A4Z1L6L6_9HELO|nr:uncharacterized protein EAF01_005017 [Botrytis porri]KAF7907431.1 hypothetical protein EAF01_005017 [Botrytis porri]TGO92415.1 hypothetical protein BPOR_0003g00130 [Botrytis porri]
MATGKDSRLTSTLSPEDIALEIASPEEQQKVTAQKFDGGLETRSNDWDFGSSDCGVYSVESFETDPWNGIRMNINETSEDHSIIAGNDLQSSSVRGSDNWLMPTQKDVKERGFDIGSKDMGESSYVPLDPNLIPSDENLVQSYSLSELLQEISRVNIAIEKQRHRLAEMSTDQFTRQNRSINNTPIDRNSGHLFLKSQQLLIFPIDEVLKISYRLVRIIQDITSLISIQERDNLISTEPLAVLDDAAVLLILACYLNLLKMFDKFFSDTSASPGSPDPKFTLPLTKVGEFVVPRTMTSRSERSLIYETAQATHSLLSSTIEVVRNTLKTQKSGEGMRLGNTMLELLRFEEKALTERMTETIQDSLLDARGVVN